MSPITFEKSISTTRSKRAILNLKQEGIETEIVRKENETITLRAIAKSVDDIRCLFHRGFEKVPEQFELKEFSDVVKTILARPRTGSGGGIPLTRGEVAMLFLDGYAGDAPGLLDIRSQGYRDDDQWDGLTHDDVLAEPDAAFVWTKWEPLEVWPA